MFLDASSHSLKTDIEVGYGNFPAYYYPMKHLVSIAKATSSSSCLSQIILYAQRGAQKIYFRLYFRRQVMLTR